MSNYREEVNKYKAKRVGVIDAKVVAPKGKKKNVVKPWLVEVDYPQWPQWGPHRSFFEKEHDARAYARKQYKGVIVKLYYNGTEVAQ